MWDKLFPNQLEKEKREQDKLIQEQLAQMQLQDELRLEKITQRGLINKELQRQEEEAKEEQQQRLEQDRLKEKETKKETDAAKKPPNGNEDPKKLSMLEMARLGYQELVNAIIRPPRAEYKIEHLGPRKFQFCGREFVRKDLTLVAERGYLIECSHWIEVDAAQNVPVLIYMHGNASCRLEVLPQLSYLLVLGVSVLSFDFAGSGWSEGEYVSLGYYEREDLTCVIAHLRAQHITNIALWGRSMGAATALMYNDRDPDIGCMILDSSFSDLVQLAEEMVAKAREQGILVPGVVVSVALKAIQWSVHHHAKFNINDISPIKHAKDCKSPALFVVGEQDDFIQNHHSEKICEVYAGSKSLLVVHGDHNEPRPQVMFDSASLFLKKHLKVPGDWELPVHPSMNLLHPPWYHKSWNPPPKSNRTKLSAFADKTDEHDVPPEDVPSKDDTGFDNDEMGMTEERQKEIQHSLFKMLGHEEEGGEKSKRAVAAEMSG